MEEENFPDDFRTYKGRNWLQSIQRPTFHVYVMLAVSLLLSTTFVIVAVSKATTLSSELSELKMKFPKQKPGLDSELFPCGPNAREWEYCNGKCYYFSLQKTSWMDAKIQCAERNSHLAIIENIGEQNFLQIRTRHERYWIGLSDIKVEGHWTWLDGRDSLSGFTYWARGEPNNDGGRENCAHLWTDGKWNDVYCTYPCYYICEKAVLGTSPEHQERN
ncbi:hepatic lectin-like [Sceloporus undulatus]|uniref:hepatic lectin-like n=1 Tax=Sceloporus undulatus TaxID=8520 RepID=UPI001C4B96EE|nr:hepatic lectin-like [Sceloporus undulatus]